MKSSSGRSRFRNVNARLLRGALAYGDRCYDPASRLVRRAVPGFPARPLVPSMSPEYAAALLDTGRRVRRANAIVASILDHQWNRPARHSWQAGNFIWWHGA